jgi:hypothetical protein
MAETITNTDQLRDRIDAGQTGEKIGFPDPATVPLGGDAEAGGNPPTQQEIAIEQKAATAAAPVRQRQPRSGAVIYVAIALLFAILLIGILAAT